MQQAQNLPSTEELLRDRDWLRRLAAHLIRDRHLAEDVSQEAVVAALTTRRPIGELRPWLAACVRKSVLFQRRGEVRRVDREVAVARAESSLAGPEQALEQAELQQRVVEAVLALDEPYRTTVLMRFLMEQTVGEVARHMGCPPSTVRVRTKRALDLLRSRLRDEWSGEGSRAYFSALALLAGEASPSPLGIVMAPLLLGMKLQNALLLFALAALSLTAMLILPQAPLAPIRGGGKPAALGRVEDAESMALAGQDRQPGRTPARDERGAGVLVPSSGAFDAAPPSAAGPEPVRELWGQVVGAAGVPLADATLELYYDAQDISAVEPFQVASTGLDGSFNLGDLTPLAPILLRVSATGYALHVDKVRPGDAGRIVLAGSTRLVGVVRDDGGKPVLEARITVQRPHAPTRRSVTTLSAADGSYELTGLPGGVGVVVAVGAPGCLPSESNLRLRSSGETRHDVTLPVMTEFSGVVIDYETGAPISGATLSARGGQSLGASDGQGRFSLRLPARRLRDKPGVALTLPGGEEITGSYLGAFLQARAPGYCATSAPLWTSTEAEFLLPLTREGRLVGRVEESNGQPAEGVSVRWRQAPVRFLSLGAMATYRGGAVSTDGEGRFLMEGVPCAPDYGGALQLRRGSVYVDLLDACPSAPGETRTLEVTLEPRLGLRGRLLVNGVGEFGYVWLLDQDGEPGASFETDEAGNFMIDGLADGSHRLQGCTGDGSAVYSEPHDVTLPLAFSFEVHIRTQFGRLAGRVTGTSGAPLVGVPILCVAQRGEGQPGRGSVLDATTETGADGTFVLRLAPAESADRLYTVKAVRAGARHEVIDLAEGRDDIHFVLPDTTPVRLVVRRAETLEAVPAVSVEWRQPSTDTSATLFAGLEVPTEDGALELELPVGELELTLAAPSLGLQAKTFELSIVPSEEVFLVELELP